MKIKKVLDVTLSVICTLINLYFLYTLINVNIIPDAFMIVIGAVLILINIYLCIRFKNTKEMTVIIKEVLMSIMIVALYIGVSLIEHYFTSTVNFFEAVNNNNYNSHTYQLYVSEESEITEVDQLDGENIGYENLDINNIDMVMEKLNEDIDSVNVGYSSTYEMIVALDSEISGLIISDSQYELIEENDPEVLEGLVLLKEYGIAVDNVISQSEKNVTNESFIVYITGFDKYGNISLTGRSDVNMLAVVDPIDKEISLVSIPRDYYVELPGYGSLKDKLTHAGVYGLDVSIGAIENLLDIEIDHYVKINFSTVVDFVDIIGPIEVNSVMDFCSWTNCYTKGINILDGEKALEFSRERYNLPKGDIDRAYNQQLVINGIIKAASSPDILLNYTNILSSLSSSFATSFTDKDITSLVKMQLSDFSTWKTSNYVINGYGSSEYTYSYPSQKLSVLLQDSNSLAEAKEIIKDALN
ncbi:MAG: LCP family protein [bacterium]